MLQKTESFQIAAFNSLFFVHFVIKKVQFQTFWGCFNIVNWFFFIQQIVDEYTWFLFGTALKLQMLEQV